VPLSKSRARARARVIPRVAGRIPRDAFLSRAEIPTWNEKEGRGGVVVLCILESVQRSKFRARYLVRGDFVSRFDIVAKRTPRKRASIADGCTRDLSLSLSLSLLGFRGAVSQILATFILTSRESRQE